MSTEDTKKAISSARKRRGVAKASISHLLNRLGELETDPSTPNTQLVAQQALKSLETYSSDFKLHRFALVDLIEDEHSLREEQAALNAHDDAIADLVTRLKLIISPCDASTPAEPNKVAARRLNHLKKGLTSACEEISAIPAETADVCLVRQREEQLSEFKKELSIISRELLTLDLDDEHELMATHSQMEREIFDKSLMLKRILSAIRDAPTTPTSDSKSVKLPKIDVPTFNGNILQWRGFWEQYSVAIHSRSDLSDPEKLVYLRHSIKDGSAKSVIEGLSRTGEHYTEAVECLQARYNKPRLIHQAHVRKILEIPMLKESNGKELRQFHDLAQQHLRALKAMGQEPSGSFISSTLELKLDTGTMFEWQKHSQASNDVPHYQELLDFISLRVQASEASISEGFRKTPGSDNRKNFVPGKGTTLFATSTGPESCVVCKNVKHPLYSCPRFKAMDHDKMIATAKNNDLCMNCLKHGHFMKQCRSLYRCRDCQKPHHSLLHLSPKRSDPGSTGSKDPTNVYSHTVATLSQCSLLMTFQVMLISNGLSMKARALLDSGSTTLFISCPCPGPLCIKLGRARKPVIVKAYMCIFVALSVKAVYLEAVSDLTTESFIACLRRFISRRGKPSTIWSDHGTNFVGASRELTELTQFLHDRDTDKAISEFCSTEHIEWKFIPERAPHFGGLWEAGVRSMKSHLRRVVGEIKLTFEELTTVLTQIEASLNSRPLTSGETEEGIEPLTPGHFLIGKPIQALPDPPSSYQNISVLRRWNLCQLLVRQFWKRWSSEYFTTLRKFSKFPLGMQGLGMW